MVDVGYFIDGRHGVIRNVSLTTNPYSDHRVFTSADCTEQYCMKVDNIEYVIPHEEECKVNVEDVCKPYTEERMIELCQSVDKPLTNAEKFKEVFGFEPNRDNFSLCDMMHCNYCKDYCQGCPCDNNNWDDPYVKAEVENEDR